MRACPRRTQVCKQRVTALSLATFACAIERSCGSRCARLRAMQRGRCNSRRVLRNCTVDALLIAAVASCDLRSQSFAAPLTPPAAAATQAAAPSAIPAPPSPPLPLDHIDLAWTTSLVDEQPVSGFAWHDAFLLSGPAGLRAFDVITGSERFRRRASLNGGYELGRWVASPLGHVQDIERGTPGPRLECPGDGVQSKGVL